jgi:transcriptional regulator with XRE-family HTH domain
MKVKIKKLRAYLIRKKMSNAELARAMGVSASEIEKMLNGEAVGVNTTRKFIRYFTADEAQAFIDWDALGKVNPLACEADKEQPDDEENCFDGEDEIDEEVVGELLDEDDRYGDDFNEDDDL